MNQNLLEWGEVAAGYVQELLYTLVGNVCISEPRVSCTPSRGVELVKSRAPFLVLRDV